jgi:hypothetical protein
VSILISELINASKNRNENGVDQSHLRVMNVHRFLGRGRMLECLFFQFRHDHLGSGHVHRFLLHFLLLGLLPDALDDADDEVDPSDDAKQSQEAGYGEDP